jgi:hypothetical protein
MKNVFKYGLLLALIGAGIGVYLWNKPFENMDSAKTDVELSASELFTAFADNEAQANEAYLDKVIAVTGKVREVTNSPEGITKVTLDSGDEMFGVICQLDELSDHQRTDFQPGESVTFKGKCTGMLMDVVLVRCVEVE